MIINIKIHYGDQLMAEIAWSKTHYTSNLSKNSITHVRIYILTDRVMMVLQAHSFTIAYLLSCQRIITVSVSKSISSNY